MKKIAVRGALTRVFLFFVVIFALVAQSCGTLFPWPSSFVEEEGQGLRLVLVADLHLPYKATKLESAAEGEALIAAKLALRDDLNSWTDAQRLVVVGDITGERGCPSEYAFALSYLSGLSAPLRPVAGNHEYVYADEYGATGSIVRCSSEERVRKLEYFRTSMGLETLQREEKLGGYELIYLSTDSLDTKHLVGISPESLAWLDDCLTRAPSLPTIIFFHAPLAGTLNVHDKPASGSSVAQPAAAIDEILKRHPQVFLWVSGHTHTSPSNSSFASSINLYDGRITNIHCPDANRVSMYTNSLWLYPDHVLVRTYDHRYGRWLRRFDRRIAWER